MLHKKVFHNPLHIARKRNAVPLTHSGSQMKINVITCKMTMTIWKRNFIAMTPTTGVENNGITLRTFLFLQQPLATLQLDHY